VLPKAWLVADMGLQLQEFRAELERVRQRLVDTRAQVEAQGRRIEALRKRVAHQRSCSKETGKNVSPVSERRVSS
jgi:DNA repair exonuclease SbcCD ATPase subunit